MLKRDIISNQVPMISISRKAAERVQSSINPSSNFCDVNIVYNHGAFVKIKKVNISSLLLTKLSTNFIQISSVISVMSIYPFRI